ncbi:hypothetical protein ACFQ4C_21460 [Larkinella insperata]|uniref:Uncharacterized protein n=1 Tax=Larkinella insperata TaxID=332158 RepID=A0ABW3QD74_9BACT
MDKPNVEESINKLRSQMLTLQTAITHLEQKAHFQSGFCVLDTLQAQRGELMALKNRQRICQERLELLLL